MPRDRRPVAPETDGHRDARLMLLVPVSAIITAAWVAAGVRAVWFGDVQMLVIVSGPFTLLCGYLFGISLMNRTEGSQNG